MDAEHWTIKGVGLYLEEHDLGQYKGLFCDENRIDGRVLLTLSEEDLHNPPLNISNETDVKRLLGLLENLRKEKKVNYVQKNCLSDRPVYSNYNAYNIDLDQQYSPLLSGQSSPCGTSTLDSDDESVSIRNLKLDKKRFGFSMLYLFVSHFISSVCVTMAQEHMPDKKKYTPLPDIFLDNLPYVPWAFRVTEGAIGILSTIGILLLVFHKHRLIMMQRLMIITATLYLLRCVLIMTTAIPMPQKHYDCERLGLKNTWEQITHALRVYVAIGMKTNGLKTCGDYLYSGHTVIITMLVFSINEYTPRSWTVLHLLTWITGIFGAFFILLGHGHYTLDIVLAFVISAKLFSLHHTFAINLSQMRRDKSRILMCFPIFYFFEYKTDGHIPNEYEWPLPRVTKFLKDTVSRSVNYYCITKPKPDK